MATVTIKVTAEDIARGEREGTTKCPVARAVCRELECDLGWVTVAPEAGRFAVKRWTTPDRMLFQHELSAEVARRILCFDEGGAMEPFEFTMEVPDDAA